MSSGSSLFDIDYVGDGFCTDRSSLCALTYAKRLNLLHKRSIPFTLPSVTASPSKFDSQTMMTEKSIQEIVKTSSHMIAKLKRSGENSSRNDNFLIDQYFQRGLAYEKLNKIDRAITDFTTCISIDRNCAAAYFNRSNLLTIQRNIPAAIDDLNKAVDLEPDNMTYIQNRQMLLRESGLYLHAISDAKRSVFIARVQHSKEMDLNSSHGSVKSIELAFSVAKNTRSDDDLLPIIQIIKNSKMFNQFDKEPHVLAGIASKMELTDCKKGEVLYEEGGSNLQLHIILSGEIKIAKNIQFADESGNLVKELATLVTLSKGQFFGHGKNDLVPMEDDSTGLLSVSCIVTQNDTRLLTLQKEDYNAILSQFNLTLRNEAMLMLQKSCYSFFRSWDEDKLRVMAASATVKYFNFNKKIVRAGSVVKHLYILRKGLVKIIKPAPKFFLLRSGEYAEVGLDGKVKSKSPQSTPDIYGSRSPALASVFVSQKSFPFAPVDEDDADVGTLHNSGSFMMGRFSPSSSERHIISPLSTSMEVSGGDSDNDSAERRSSGNVWSRHMHGKQLSFPLSSPTGNRRQGSVSSAGSTSNFTKLSANSGGSSRNNRGTHLNLSSSEEWFTVATLMPDQVFGETSILHQMDKFTPPSGEDVNTNLSNDLPLPDLPISTYSAVACTAVEVYCFEADMLLSMGIAQNDRIIKQLRECLKSNDPSTESIVAAYNSKFKKTSQKSRILRALT